MLYHGQNNKRERERVSDRERESDINADRVLLWLAAMAQTSLCIRTVSPVPSLLSYSKYGYRKKVVQKH